jgi:3-oxoacyl-[acyl-carrier-protein] synthase-1
MNPIAILSSGMVTGVGLTAASSCAAIRCAIDNFSETRFMGKAGDWIIGSEVPFEQAWRGLTKMVHMVAPAIRECLDHIGIITPDRIPLLLCVAEKGRPGRLEGLDDRLFDEVQLELGVQFHPSSVVIPRGRIAGALAVKLASKLIHDEHAPFCVIAGVDTFLVASTLAAYEEKERLLTSQNSNGFIPGEAGAAVLVGPAGRTRSPEIVCLGYGEGIEMSTIQSEEPLRADGLSQAFRAAFVDSGTSFADLDFRITDSNGEQYWFKEAALALSRTCRQRKERFEIWHPADCIGETGAAAGPSILAIAEAAARKSYSPGPGMLCHFGNDDGERLALILNCSHPGAQ